MRRVKTFFAFTSLSKSDFYDIMNMELSGWFGYDIMNMELSGWFGYDIINMEPSHNNASDISYSYCF